MKKGFTLIEMVIVIAILSVLMTITMRFGSGRINELKYQNTKEQFISAYEKIYSKNMTSNYNDNIRYEALNINLKPNQNQIYYSFDSGDIQRSYIQGNIYLTGIGETNLYLTPYKLGCDIKSQNQTGSEVNLDIIVDNIKKYCFEIKSDTCKLIEKICPIVLNK